MATSGTPAITNDLESLTCKICFCVFREPKLLECGHTFCLLCLKSVIKKGKNKIECPFCRFSTKVRRGNVENLTPNRALMSLVEDVMHLEGSCGRCNKLFKRMSLYYCYQRDIYMCVKCKAIHWKHFEVQSKADHMKSQNCPTLSNLITQCQVHPGELNTKVCLSCDKQLCNKCEENHPKESHELKSNVTFVNELRVNASALQQDSTFLVNECKDSYQTVLQNEQEANILLSKLKQEINDDFVTSVERLDRRRIFLLKSVEVLRNKIAKREKDMAKFSMESTDLLMKINASTDQMLRFPLNKMSVHVAHLNENRSKVNAVISRKNENTKLSSDIVSSIQKMHLEKSLSPNDSSIGVLTIHDWNRTDIPLRYDTMSCATLHVEGKIAVGYFDGGVELISVNGSKRTVLKEVQVLAIACLNRGDIVLRDIDNGISIYDVKLKKSQAKFSTLGKEEGGEGDMAVNTRDDIFVSFKRVNKIHIYSRQGGEAIRIIDCGLVIPQQITATAHSEVLVMDASQVWLINEQGKVTSGLNRDGYFGYPSVSSDGSLFIAWVHQKEQNVRILQYTNQLKPSLSPLVLADYSLRLIRRNWYQLQLRSPDEIALISPDTIHLYRRQKTPFSDDSPET